MSQHTDDQMAALVTADPTYTAPPDLAALRADGRRRLIRTRVVVGASALAVIGAVAVPVAILSGDESRTAPTPPTSSNTSAPTETPSVAKKKGKPRFKVRKERSGEIILPDGTRPQGAYVDSKVLGEPLVFDRLGDYDELLFVFDDTAEGASQPTLVVSTGVQTGDGLLRLGGTALLGAGTEMPKDGIALYDGARISDYAGRDPYFRVIGLVRGEVDLMVSDSSGATYEVTASSTTFAPGYTAFVAQGRWNPEWDELKLAPLAVSTDDGRSVQVRRLSFSS